MPSPYPTFGKIDAMTLSEYGYICQPPTLHEYVNYFVKEELPGLVKASLHTIPILISVYLLLLSES